MYTDIETIMRELATGSGSVTLPVGYYDVLGNMIAEASALVDAYKRVESGAYKRPIVYGQGSAITNATARTWRGTYGSEHLHIDNCIAVTEAALWQSGGTYRVLTAETDYETWPYNATAIGEPIRRLNRIDYLWPLTPVRVTAVWGVSQTVPDLVARAVAITVQQWYGRALQGWQDTSSIPDLGQLRYTKALDSTAMLLLDKVYPRPRGIGIQ